MSSVPILISPDAGKAAELVRTTLVVGSSGSVVPRVVVAAPGEVPDHRPVPNPYPPNCLAGPTL